VAGHRSSTSPGIAESTPGTVFVGSGNIATDNASLLGKRAADTLARMRDKVLGKLDRPVFQIQGLQLVPLRDKTVGIPTALFRGEAPRLRGAVSSGQQDFPWLETSRRLGYNLESLLRGDQHPGLTRQRLSPQAIADEFWKVQFAYNRRSDFKNNVTRRVVPFSTFTSGNLPLQRVPRLVVPRLAKNGELALHGYLTL
jgi:hypothetical protein